METGAGGGNGGNGLIRVQGPRRIQAAILLAGLLLAGGIAGFKIHARRVFFTPSSLLSRFPAEDALVLSADFAILRRAGLLTQSKAPVEAEYKQFLNGTGFDYKRDLDSLVASFSRSGTFFIVRGRFDWKTLRDYAARQGGSCYEDLCRLQGSTPERHISFLPLRNDALALAVSTNDLAATRLEKAGEPVTTPLPSAPVWLSVPGAELRRLNALPPGMHLMLSAMTSADRVVITLGPGAQGIEAELQATCRTQDDARILASQLRSTTGLLLKEAFARDKSAPDGELAAMLTAGSFDQKDRSVTGKWPVRKSLVDALTRRPLNKARLRHDCKISQCRDQQWQTPCLSRARRFAVMKLFNLKGTLLLSAILITPAALLAQTENQKTTTTTTTTETQRYYDPANKDYHNWSSTEDRAYRMYMQEKHRSYVEFPKETVTEQTEYWRWRHDHPDTVIFKSESTEEHK